MTSSLRASMGEGVFARALSAVGNTAREIGSAVARLVGRGDKALEVAGDTERLAQRASEIHSALHPIGQAQRTTSVLGALDRSGRAVDVIASGARDLSPAQRALAKAGDILGKLPGKHAEITNLVTAGRNGLRPVALVATRDFCARCIEAVQKAGGVIVDPRTAVWPR